MKTVKHHKAQWLATFNVKLLSIAMLEMIFHVWSTETKSNIIFRHLNVGPLPSNSRQLTLKTTPLRSSMLQATPKRSSRVKRLPRFRYPTHLDLPERSGKVERDAHLFNIYKHNVFLLLVSRRDGRIVAATQTQFGATVPGQRPNKQRLHCASITRKDHLHTSRCEFNFTQNIA